MANDNKLLGQFEESKRGYLNNGAFWQAGEIWKQPDLAATIARTLGLLDKIAAEPDPAAVLGWRPGPGRAHIGD